MTIPSIRGLNEPTNMKDIINSEPSYDRKLELMNPIMRSALSLKIFIDEDIHDIVQDTNVILINKKHEFNESKSFFSWAFSILHFQVLKYFTTKKRKKECELLDNHQNTDFFDENTPRHFINKKEWIISKQYKLNKIKKHHMSDREREFVGKFIEGKSKISIIKEMGLKNKSQYNTWKTRVVSRVKNHQSEY